jgi:hypothetical protein
VGRVGDSDGKTRQSKGTRLPPSRWLTSLRNRPESLNSTDEDVGRVGDVGGENRQSMWMPCHLPGG